MQFLYGADPEVFLSLGDKYISAHGLFPGSKVDPYRVEKGAIQVDGLALEFNIDPAKTREEFNENIETVLRQMNEMVRSVDKDMKINFVPIARFDEKEFEEYPEQAKLLGCDPDFNVSGNMNTPPEDLIHMALRTASGHVHIGWTEKEDPFNPEHFSDCLNVVRRFQGRELSDLTYEERERLQYYGGNESFRPKSYGVELRKFSNLWVAKKETRLQMFDFVDSVMKELS